jgi:hypothetical protein
LNFLTNNWKYKLLIIQHYKYKLFGCLKKTKNYYTKLSKCLDVILSKSDDFLKRIFLNLIASTFVMKNKLHLSKDSVTFMLQGYKTITNFQKCLIMRDYTCTALLLLNKKLCLQCGEQLVYGTAFTFPVHFHW